MLYKCRTCNEISTHKEINSATEERYPRITKINKLVVDFDTSSVNYIYVCPSCNREYAQSNFEEIKPNNIRRVV